MKKEDQGNWPATPVKIPGEGALPWELGLSKREWLAGMAMQCMSQDLERYFLEPEHQLANKMIFIAAHAVRLADALLKELEKKDNA